MTTEQILETIIQSIEVHKDLPCVVAEQVYDHIVELAEAKERLEKYESTSVDDDDQLPATIYLQLGDDDDCSDAPIELDGVSWFKDKVFNHDVPYVRADIYQRLIDKLPKYVDGTSFVPNVDPACGVDTYMDHCEELEDFYINDDGEWEDYCRGTTKFYPTREAAEEARDKNEN